MNTLYVRCQTKDYMLDIVAVRAGMRINKVNSDFLILVGTRKWFYFSRICQRLNAYYILYISNDTDT